MTPSALHIERLGAETHRRALPLLRLQLDEHGIELAPAALEQAVHGLVAVEGRGALLLAMIGHDAVGVAALSFLWALEQGGKAAWLDELYVLAPYRNQGFGEILLGAAIEVARSSGNLALDLEVEASHARAVSLYLRNGFRRRSRERFWLPLRSE
jgi:GNAT superfamily N-acetyltransferase